MNLGSPSPSEKDVNVYRDKGPISPNYTIKINELVTKYGSMGETQPDDVGSSRFFNTGR